ncbi:hypothetical protein AALP_AA3G324900 [Arabis alpina]|uniref:Uncharacterized protein n=1 Tax=Arabis alpina TaxID=50452 RepID=A0A087HD55_ARAAL|nr:hypothetical protein AALP_AA3G324900 [Arabis alpina]
MMEWSWRISGKEDDISFAELEALDTQLKDVLLIVQDLKKVKLEENERLLKKEVEDHGTKRAEKQYVASPLTKRMTPLPRNTDCSSYLENLEDSVNRRAAQDKIGLYLFVLWFL